MPLHHITSQQLGHTALHMNMPGSRLRTRSCFKSVFCLGALRKDPGFLEKFEKHDIYGKRAFAKALPVGELEPDAAEILSQFFDDLDRSGERGERLKWESVANSVGLGHVAGLPRSRPVSQRCETAPSFSSSQTSRYRAALGFYKRAFSGIVTWMRWSPKIRKLRSI